MNWPYLIEPYNAYTHGKTRKKHWTELMEEEALYHRMVQEALVREAKTQQMTVQDSVQNGQTAAQTQGDASTGTSAGAGAGGTPPYSFFQDLVELAEFDISPTSGAGPLTLTFLNRTRTPEDDIFFWDFGSGSLTSTDASPSPLLYTKTGSYTIALQSTSSAGAMSRTTKNITIASPTVTAGFTFTTASNYGPVTASFVNTTVNTSQTPTTTYLWNFGDGTTSTTNSASLTHGYTLTGSITASLQATGSYGIASMFTRSFELLPTTLAAALTVRTSSNVGPMTASFTASYTYAGNGTVDGLIYDIPGGYRAVTGPLMMFETIEPSGSFTASMQVTESSYNTMAGASATPWSASAPSLVISLAVTLSAATAPATASYTASYLYNGPGTVTGNLNIGDNATFVLLGTGHANPLKIESGVVTQFLNPGVYTASMYVTESSYNTRVYTEYGFELS